MDGASRSHLCETGRVTDRTTNQGDDVRRAGTSREADMTSADGGKGR